jgi:hypothetical protein
MAMTLDGSNGVTFNDASLQGAAASPFGLKNRLINSDMRIDQRNAGASVTATTSNLYTIDRWQSIASQSSKYTVQQNAGSVTTPAGFNNYLGITSSSAYTVLTGDYFAIVQKIEGFNFADLNWGTANAQTVTLSFRVYSSLTGTFGGVLQNYASTRSYPFTYTISTANTWTTISVTIAGDTSGTWVGASSNGAATLIFGLGAGSTYNGTAGAWASANYLGATGATNIVSTNGATFYITGVQLEIGTSATPFERRLYNQELANCQRYYQRLGTGTVADIIIGSGISRSSTLAAIYVKHNTPMRAAPTVTQSSLVITDAETYNATVTSISINASLSESRVVATCSGGGMTQYRTALLSQITSGTGYLDLSAEL